MNSAEISLVTKMRALGAKPEFPVGLTTLEQRRDAVRAVLDPLLDVTFTIQNGKRITMAMQFARAYGMVP